MKKKWFVLSVLTLFCTGMNVQAEDASVWTMNTNSYAVEEYTGTATEVVIPDTLEDCPVEIIGKDLFEDNSTITSVVIPENCNTIETGAFRKCESLSGVTLPESLQVIGESAFYQSALAEIRIPAAVGYIARSAFKYCDSLNSISFEGEVPGMGMEVFFDTSDHAVFYVPDDRIEEYRAALPEGADVQPGGWNVTTVDYLSEDFEIDPDTGVITYYNGYAPIVEVPAEIGGVAVTGIGESAFMYHYYLYRVDLPEGLTSIGPKAFYQTSHLSDVNFPSTLKKIEDGAFASFKGNYIDLP